MTREVRAMETRFWEISMMALGLALFIFSVILRQNDNNIASQLFLVGAMLCEVEAGLRLTKRYFESLFPKHAKKRSRR
jgi:hypothetical protein